MPVGTAFSPAASSSSITRVGASGVAMSISVTARPRMLSRTQPPTKRTSAPPAVSAATTARVAGALIQGCGGRYSIAISVAGRLEMSWLDGAIDDLGRQVDVGRRGATEEGQSQERDPEQQSPGNRQPRPGHLGDFAGAARARIQDIAEIEQRGQNQRQDDFDELPHAGLTILAAHRPD